MNEIEVTNKVQKRFHEVIVEAQVSNTKHGFSHRLVCGAAIGEWRGYTGVATLEVKGRLFIHCSQYFDGCLPFEEPLEVVKGK
jgi:hypothetical protein